MALQRVVCGALRLGMARLGVVGRTVPSIYVRPAITTPLRSIQTHKMSQVDAERKIANQRLRRPVSPHLGIYKLDQTWFGSSIWMRFTGCAVGGAVYGYFISYALAPPLLGWNPESASLVAAFAGLPVYAKGGVKFTLAFPFAFHFFNGIKHLIYDAGYGYAKETMIMADYIIWAVGVVAAAYVAWGLV